MSTKTTFKRVALVAVAALSMGVLTSVAPASAAANTNLTCSVSYLAAGGVSSTGSSTNGAAHTYTMLAADQLFVVGQLVTIADGTVAYRVTNAPIIATTSTTITVLPTAPAAVGTAASVVASTINLGTENKTCKGLAGPANTVTLSSTSVTLREYLSVSGGTFNDGTTGKTIGTLAVGVVTPGSAVVLTPTAGTITITGYAETANGSGLYSSAATDSITIVVAAAGVGTVYSSATATVVSGANGTARKVTDLDGVNSYYDSATKSLTSSSFVATVTQKDSAGVAITDPLLSKVVTASIAGVGTLSIGDGVTSAQGGYVSQGAGLDASNTIRVYADGRAGTGTVTIAVNGVTVKTFTVTFYGAVASYSVTTNKNYIPVGSAADVFTISALDVNGVRVPNAPIYAASSASTTASVDATHNTADWACGTVDTCTAADLALMGKVKFSMTGVAKGAVTVTFTDLAASATITKTATTKVTGSQAATLTWAFDKADYVVGSPVSLVFTLKDSDSNPVANGTYTIFAATPTSTLYSATLNGAVPAIGMTVDVADGVGTWDFFAPVTSGTLTIAGTLASGSALAAALRGVNSSATATVSNTDTQAATDAAAEATDAANAATDAANAAAEAADAATAAAQDASDAVAALSAQVATLISALRAQLTSLTNLVIKIQKKVKA